MKTRYVYDPDQKKMVEIKQAAPRKARFFAAGEFDEFISPIDKKPITSRRELREHERRYNVRQSGNDWTSSEKPAFWDKMVQGG